jgi:hypothetical protein
MTLLSVENDRADGVFTERPSSEFIDDFLAHVRKAGDPVTWRWHSHTAPGKGAKPVLMKTFDVPESFAKDPERWARCPLCAPQYPKYKFGVLVWFPESGGGDGRIRAIGNECGAKYFGKAAYRMAQNVYRREQDEEAQRAYLARALPVAPDLIVALESLAKRAQAAHLLRTQLLKFLPRDFVRTLQQATIAGGVLTVQAQVRVSYIGRDGTPGERVEFQPRPLASVKGAAFLYSGDGSPEQIRVKALQLLANIPPASGLPDMNSDEVHALAKRIQLAFDCAEKMHAALEFASLFAADENLNALQRWTMHADSGAQVRMITLDGRPRVSVYRRVNSRVPGSNFRDVPDIVNFDECLRQTLGAIPTVPK